MHLIVRIFQCKYRYLHPSAIYFSPQKCSFVYRLAIIFQKSQSDTWAHSYLNQLCKYWRWKSAGQIRRSNTQAKKVSISVYRSPQGSLEGIHWPEYGASAEYLEFRAPGQSIPGSQLKQNSRNLWRKISEDQAMGRCTSPNT